MKRLPGMVLLAFSALVWNRAPAAVKPPFPHEPLGVANGCLVESVCFYDHYQELFGPESWVRVLQWGAKENDEVVAGHAVAVFELKGRLWAWDVNFGFKPLEVPPDSREDVAQVAPPIVAKYPGIVPQYPMYRYDSSQPPADHPPEVLAMHEVQAFRDATLVGARLGAHRPVNVVQFSYVEGGEVKQSAATVFIFGGRLFVYFPGRGTIPFASSQRSILNLSQLRYAFGRIYTGASSLKSLNYTTAGPAGN